MVHEFLKTRTAELKKEWRPCLGLGCMKLILTTKGRRFCDRCRRINRGEYTSPTHRVDERSKKRSVDDDGPEVM